MKNQYIHIKTKWGYRQKDQESGLFVCGQCNGDMNQETRVPYDTLCPSCRVSVNLFLIAEKIAAR